MNIKNIANQDIDIAYLEGKIFNMEEKISILKEELKILKFVNFYEKTNKIIDSEKIYDHFLLVGINFHHYSNTFGLYLAAILDCNMSFIDLDDFRFKISELLLSTGSLPTSYLNNELIKESTVYLNKARIDNRGRDKFLIGCNNLLKLNDYILPDLEKKIILNCVLERELKSLACKKDGIVKV